MNWIITILIITVASLLATIFNFRKEKKRYGYSRRQNEAQNTVYEYIWPTTLLLNLVIGLLMSVMVLGTRFTVPYIIAWVVGTFFVAMFVDGAVFGKEKITVGASVILVILAVPAVGITFMIGVNNASSFDTMIITTSDDLFANEIPDNMVRLVTEEYAEFIVKKQALADFGSNRKIAATSIVEKDGRLVWVCVIVSTNTFAENYIQGMVVVDANTAEVTDILQSHEIDFTFAEGLFWDKNIQMANYWNDARYKYSDAYPTWDDEGELVYVQTRTHVDSMLVEVPVGPIIYYQDQGPIVYETIEDAPSWLPRAYSEDWLERQVDRWGSSRRGNTFDLFASGFLGIPPSSDRLEMSEDVRYILNPDNMKIEALVTAHPITAELSLKGVFRGTSTGVIFHDYSDRNFVAGQGAIDNIVGTLPMPAQGYYDGAMPLLYPIVIGNETRWTWYCPIYFYRTIQSSTKVTNIELHALAMIDATDARTFYIQETEGGFIGENLVQAAKAGYADLFGEVIVPSGNETIIISDVLNKVVDEVNGNTRIILQTNNTEFELISGFANDMNFTDWYDLLSIEVGQVFQAVVILTSDGQYRIIAFVRLV